MIIMKDNKRASIGPGMIKGIIVSLIFLTVLLKISPSLIHTSQESVQELGTEFSNSSMYGAGASSIGTQISDYSGYFWVVGVLLVIITVVLGVFMTRRR